jgi:hypothetical protein
MILSRRCRALAMYCAMPYSNPPVIVDGLFPSQKPGPGRFVATVSTPGVAGRKPRNAGATVPELCVLVADPAAFPQAATAQPVSIIRVAAAMSRLMMHAPQLAHSLFWSVYFRVREKVAFTP